MRRIRYRDAESENNLIFRTNHFLLPTLTIAELYRCRWQVKWFFPWIQQHLRIKKCYGLSPHAVKTPIGIAISGYLLVAIVRKRLGLDLPLYTMSQILSRRLFEKMPMLRAFSHPNGAIELDQSCNQFDLFDL